MKLLVLDVETEGLAWYKHKLHGVGIATSGGTTKYFPAQEGFPPQLRAALADESIAKAMHNARFDLKFLRAAGFEVRGPIYCTRIMAQLVNENEPLGLKDLSAKYLPEGSLADKRELDRAISQAKVKHVGELCALDLGDMVGAYTDLIARYCLEDCRNTLALFNILWGKLQAKDARAKEYFQVEKGPLNYYLEESMPTELALLEMEMRGVNVNLPALETMKKDLEREGAGVEAKIKALCKTEIKAIEDAKYEAAILSRKSERGKSNVSRSSEKYKTQFSLSSNGDIGLLLYEQLGLPGQVTAKGNYRVDVGALGALEAEGRERDVLELILKYRSIEKLRGTYAEGFAERCHYGKLYPGYPQYTVTGRLSSEDPNFQNIPRGCAVKRALVPSSSDNCFIYADYSQVELRIAAHLSQDPQMLEAFQLDLDPHAITAASIFGVPESEVTKEQRQVGKTCNFLLIYDGGPMRLQEELKNSANKEFSMEECKAFKEAYFSRYPVYKKHLYRMLQDATKAGAVISEAGRVRSLADLVLGRYMDTRRRVFNGPAELCERLKTVQGVDLYDKAGKAYSHAKKQLANFPVQSLGASITKAALIALREKGFTVVTTVHDSIIVEVPKGRAAANVVDVRNILEAAYTLSVPLKVDVKILNSFDESDLFQAAIKAA